MKKSQLRKVIREAITEVLNEVGQTPGHGAVKVKKGDIATIKKYTAQGIDVEEDPTLKEVELDELANIGTLFQLAPDTDLSTLTGQKLRIATAMQDSEGPITQKGIALALGYDKQNPINANFLNMVRDGIIVPAGVGMQAAPRFSQPQPTPGEEGDEEVGQRATEPEDLFMGSATNPLAMYFDNEPNANSEEDFNTEEEPTIGDIEPSTPAQSGRMSDADYEAFMQYSDLNDRLSATKSNLLKLKRNKRGGVAGDISDRPSNEEARLRDLKDRLQKKVDDLVAGSEYLQKRIEKQTGKTYVAPVAEPEEDEEDTLDESFNRDYEMRKLQFYAGIIK